MKIVRYVVLSLSSLPNTYLLTRWWLGSWWSERAWTWLNQTFGQDIGLASDVELFLVLACAFSLSFATMSFLSWVLQMTYDTKNQKVDHKKEVLCASLTVFWVLFATYFLLWLGYLFGIQAADGKVGLAFWVNLSVSLISASAVTLLGFFLWRHISKRANE